MTKENDKIKFTLRMNEKQKRKLARLAEKAGVSQCQYLLGLLDGISFRPKPPQEFWELMKELSFLHKILLQFGEGKHVFKQVQEFLGHEQASTTLDIYTHLNQESRMDTALTIDSILTAAG